MPKTPRKRMSLWVQVAFYTGLGFIVPVYAVGGYALGWLLDGKLHTAPIFQILLAFLGAAGGVFEILRIMKRAEKRDEGDDADDGPDAG